MGFSYPIGPVLIVDAILLYAISRTWDGPWVWLFQAIYLGLMGLFLWEALSAREFEKIQKTRPEMRRQDWILNWVAFFVVLPGAVWLALLVAKLA